MLETVRAFGRSDVELHEVHATWQRTAETLNLDAEAFFAFWNVSYWEATSFDADRPVDETVWCARWAASLGVPSIILTSRIDDTHELTLVQLARLALAPVEVITKPALTMATPAFKVRQVRTLLARGVMLGAFITDSLDELEAVRAAVPTMPCILVVLDGAPTPSVGSDVPVWTPAPMQDARNGDVLLPAGLALTPWMLHEIARELDVDLTRVIVAGPITHRAQLDALCAQLYWDRQRAFAALDRVRRAACEHALNDRAGCVRTFDGDLHPRTSRAELFALPLTALSPERAVIVRSQRFDVSSYELALAGVLPVHPQELAHRTSAHAVRTVSVRATASGRTVRAQLASASVLLKCDLSHVFMDRHRRSVTLRDAELAIKNSDFLAANGVCLLPEVFAVADGVDDVACVVRCAEPFPAGVAGSWTIPAFCLWAPGGAFATREPLVHAFLSHMGPEALRERLLHPLVACMATLMLDLGCAFLGHGQNVHVELGRDGLPTGRIVLCDMEDVWVHPLLCDAKALPYVIDDAYRRAHAATCESDIAGTFQDYFLWMLLHPLLCCIETSPRAPPSLRRDVDEYLRAEIVARRDTVTAFRDGPLQWFFDTYLAPGASPWDLPGAT